MGPQLSPASGAPGVGPDWRVDPTEIRKIKVSETWLAGERRHGS